MKSLLLSFFFLFCFDRLCSFDPDLRATETVRNNLSSPLSQNVMEFTTKLGDGRTVLLTSTVMSFGDEKLRRCGELSMASFAVSGILTVGIKYAVNRQRPNGGASSFPSGHTSTAFSWAAVVSSEYPQYRIPVFAVAGLVGISRIALDKHWTSDVIAGAFIGYFSGLFVEKISSWITDY